jgi:hypothetical protein
LWGKIDDEAFMEMIDQEREEDMWTSDEDLIHISRKWNAKMCLITTNQIIPKHASSDFLKNFFMT